MARRALELRDGIAVPIQTKPCQAIKNGSRRGVGGTFPVGVFDAQQHLATAVLGIKPVEQGSARTTNVQIPRGRGAKRVMTGFDMIAPLCRAPF